VQWVARSRRDRRLAAGRERVEHCVERLGGAGQRAALAAGPLPAEGDAEGAVDGGRARASGHACVWDRRGVRVRGWKRGRVGEPKAPPTAAAPAPPGLPACIGERVTE
jgi:hypothetical protein